jgi:hypothetical protein
MSYIGAEPTTAAFPFDQFSGNGTTTAFTLTYAPASTTSIIVAISGVVQNPNLYSVIGTTITFSPAPPTGTNNISVLYLGLPVIGVSNPGNTAYFSSTSFTATGGQTTFTPSGSYTPGFINVIRNGSQLAPANYTATNGTTVVLNNACVAGDIVVIEVFTLTSISNALPLTGGTVTGASTFNSSLSVAGNLSFNSGYGSSAVAYGCRAWVNFNGTGTVAIRASGNVTSITDNGVGDYTVNFTTAMPDANYCASLSGVQRQTASGTNQSFGYHSTDDVNATTYSTTAVRLSNKIGSITGFNDVNIVSVAIFR